MLRTYLLLLCSFIYTIPLNAQVPTNNDTLNYRIVPFITDSNEKYTDYTLQIAAGHITDEHVFNNQLITTSHSNNGRWVEEVPQWGKSYTWRIIYKGRKRKNTYKGPFYYFTTGTSNYTDTSKFRMRIIDSATQYKGMFIVLDYAPVMYDMKGNLVWYIPDIPGVIGTGRGLRDLRPTPAGTFTALNDLGAFEFDYHGKVVWKAPDDGTVNGDTTERYHHEFTRLNNGNYMLAGMDVITRRVPDDADTTYFITDKTLIRKDGWFYKKIDDPTLIEYDSAGHILWSWHLSEHFNDKEYFLRTLPSGIYNSYAHLNSFYFDEQNKVIYASLRNCDRIIKIKYPEGDIIAQYGEYLDSNGDIAGAHLFHAQHCVKLAPNGDILLFNNNTAREQDVNSYVQRFKEPAGNSGNLKKTWEFNCAIDNNAPHCALAGGGVSLLPDNSILVSMGTAGRCFVVSPDKIVTWNAIPEYKTEVGTWVLLTVYRNYFILNKNELLKFIR